MVPPLPHMHLLLQLYVLIRYVGCKVQVTTVHIVGDTCPNVYPTYYM